MTIFIKEPIAPSELNALLATNNWAVADEEKLVQALELSWSWLSARDDQGKLIGFVQVLSDGIRHAYILRLIVSPDMRGKGVGSALMERVLAILRENNLLPTLVATPGKASFYEKFGFKPESKGMKALCIR
jgi:ribosomal protein S18 acetylase RimI-like enzyme